MPETAEPPVSEDEERLVLRRDVNSVAVARDFVSQGINDPEIREVARLLASELTTNAVQRGIGDTYEVRVRRGEVLRVEVSDGSAVLPALGKPSPEQTRGRGLVLVDTFATTWGIQVQPEGKTVWFEVLLGPTGSSGQS